MEGTERLNFSYRNQCLFSRDDAAIPPVAKETELTEDSDAGQSSVLSMLNCTLLGEMDTIFSGVENR